MNRSISRPEIRSMMLIGPLVALLGNVSCNRCPTIATTTPVTTSAAEQKAKEQPSAVSGASKSTQGSWAPAPSISLSITGSVKQPLNLGLSDLKRFQPMTARLNDVHRDGGFFGVHVYRGVALRDLLEMASVAKEESVYDRPLDLMIVLRNREGAEAVLSWGEVFYNNPSEVMIAYEAEPKLPHKSCGGCHEPAVFQDRLNRNLRQVPMPKLVVTTDLWSDRCIEGIVSIEVRDMGKDVGIFIPKADKPKKMFSEELLINLPGSKPVVVKDLAGYVRFKADAIQAGDGTGYHGIRSYEGIPLRDVLLKAGITPDPGMALICSASDGYRISLSAGEVFYGAYGDRIMIADKLNGKSIEDGGRLRIVPTRDQAADRWLKSAARIDFVRTD